MARSTGSPAASRGIAVDLLRLAGVLRRRRWLILVVLAIGSGLALLAGLQRTPLYSAEATLALGAAPAGMLEADIVAGGRTAAPEAAFETEIEALLSRRHIDRVVAALELARDPEFNPTGFASGRRMRLGGAWRGLLGWLPEHWLIAPGVAGEGPDGASLRDMREEVAEKVAAGLQVERLGRSDLVAVRATAGDPDKAARIANAVAGLYLQEQSEAGGAATGRLEQRLATLHAALKASEQAVARERAARRLPDAGDPELDQRARYDLGHELAETRASLAEKAAGLQLIAHLKGRPNGFGALPDPLASPLLVELRRQESELRRSESDLRSAYGEDHPYLLQLRAGRDDLRRRMAGEVDRTRLALAAEAKVLATRIAALEGELAAPADGRREAALRRQALERAAAANRQLYESFLQRYQEVRERQAAAPPARIVSDAAPPAVPATPGPRLFLLAGFTVSALAGVLLALLLERLDRRVRSRDQLEDGLGLACLGLVPDVEAECCELRPHQFLLQQPRSSYAEAVRLAFAALRLRRPGAPPGVVQITSALPGEGKTTFAVSLAAALAQSGKRVLLLDLDPRQPGVARELPLAAERRPAAGGRRRDDAVQRDRASGVEVISLRHTGLEPTRLLSSPRMAELIGLLRNAYDCVIIDGPPLLGAGEGRLLAEFADAVMVVVRWGGTKIHRVGDALRELEAAHATVGGAVITRVDVARLAQYGRGPDGQFPQQRACGAA